MLPSKHPVSNMHSKQITYNVILHQFIWDRDRDDSRKYSIFIVLCVCRIVKRRDELNGWTQVKSFKCITCDYMSGSQTFSHSYHLIHECGIYCKKGKRNARKKLHQNGWRSLIVIIENFHSLNSMVFWCNFYIKHFCYHGILPWQNEIRWTVRQIVN